MPMDSPQGMKKAKKMLEKMAKKNSVQPNSRMLPPGATMGSPKGRKQTAKFHKKGKGEGYGN